jgi:hypothetical protein
MSGMNGNDTELKPKRQSAVLDNCVYFPDVFFSYSLYVLAEFLDPRVFHLLGEDGLTHIIKIMTDNLCYDHENVVPNYGLDEGKDEEDLSAAQKMLRNMKTDQVNVQSNLKSHFQHEVEHYIELMVFG